MQDQFNQLIATFLAEIIRSRKTTIRRAAEIARRVVYALPELTSEEAVLTFLNIVEHDFEEVVSLKEALKFGVNDADVDVYEKEIKEYAAVLFQKDVVTSSQFLQDAAKPGATMQELCIKYPEFCRYVKPVTVDGALAVLAARV